MPRQGAVGFSLGNIQGAEARLAVGFVVAQAMEMQGWACDPGPQQFDIEKQAGPEECFQRVFLPRNLCNDWTSTPLAWRN